MYRTTKTHLKIFLFKSHLKNSPGKNIIFQPSQCPYLIYHTATQTPVLGSSEIEIMAGENWKATKECTGYKNQISSE